MKKSLHARANSLAAPEAQLELLENGIFQSGELPKFSEQLKHSGLAPLKKRQLEVLQINLGYMCNQVCAHCHVDAGPDRKEKMSKIHLERCLELIKVSKVGTVDLTGGAPEMHPDFQWFVREVAALDVQDIIVRSNLTILVANAHYAAYPQFFAEQGVHVVSSLPFYKKEKTDRQRGEGVFSNSIEALKALNAVGYGQEGSGLQLDLVYNPAGAFLPAAQEQLEQDFKSSLATNYGIQFNQLFTITNLPISRFLEYLLASENYEDYMTTLVDAFNPAAVQNVMCTNTLSIDYQGYMYDCDFNQMLAIKVQSPVQHIDQFDPTTFAQHPIAISQHCYGCTAGAGSSCQGALVE